MNSAPDPAPVTGGYRVQRLSHPIDASVRVPGSKSIANRALICATLAGGDSTLHNVPDGDDTAALLDCISLLGAGVRVGPSESARVEIQGTGGALRPGPMTLHARLAGTTSRFVTALCALGQGRYDVDGLPPLQSRPMAPLHDALFALGVGIHPENAWGHLPVGIIGLPDSTRNHAEGEKIPTHLNEPSARKTITMPGDISSQYITALMLIAPYLDGGLRIELNTPLVSRPYLHITAAVMASFGVSDVVVSETRIDIAAGVYSAIDYWIEPDASSASYPLAAAAICGGRVYIEGLGTESLQGDAAFVDVLAEMGCSIDRSPLGTSLQRTGDLRGVTIDMSDLSDLVPTLAVIAPFAQSATVITGVGFIRAKESDRLGDLATELRRCGIDASEFDDGIRIEPGFGRGSVLGTHHDHRLAMAFGVLGLGIDGVVVADPEVVSKSWPDFWSTLESMGARA